MKKHSFKDWLIAVRPWSFPASAMPVIVTLAYLYWAYGVIEWANGLLALVGIVIFHASGNAWSDYFDFERGVDRVDTFGVKTLTSGKFLPDVWLIIVPVGLITVAILHANNTRDIGTDVRAKISTLAMKLGVKTDIYLYMFEVLFPFLWIAICVLLGNFPWWSLLTIIGILPAIANARTMLRLPKEGISAISNLDEKTAKLQLLFSLLFTVTFLI